MVTLPVAVVQSGWVMAPIVGTTGNGLMVKITGVLVSELQVPSFDCA